MFLLCLVDIEHYLIRPIQDCVQKSQCWLVAETMSCSGLLKYLLVCPCLSVGHLLVTCQMPSFWPGHHTTRHKGEWHAQRHITESSRKGSMQLYNATISHSNLCGTRHFNLTKVMYFPQACCLRILCSIAMTVLLSPLPNPLYQRK